MTIQTLIRNAAFAGLVAIGSSASANLVVNGGFETLTNGPNLGNLFTDAVGWTTSSPNGNYSGKGYGIFFGPGNGSGSPTAQDNNGPGSPAATLWSPIYGANNGFTGISPTGGNFWSSDADPDYSVAISQTLTGLTVGGTYRVSFDWAGAQLDLPGYGLFNGPTTEAFAVSLGGQTQSTGIVAIGSHGFSGWMHENMYFTATSATAVLSFLSGSGPQGLPPQALLDGVSATAVPEPATWAMMVVGIGIVGLAGRRRRTRAIA